MTDELTPTKSVHIAIVGRKKSGKSELAWQLFESWPYDRVLVDPNGDLKVGETAEDLESPIESSWPPRLRSLETEPPRRTLRFVPDFLAPTATEDIDRACGLAFRPGSRTMLFVDECHQAAPAGTTRTKHPFMDRNLRQSRHGTLSMILATPRPVTVDPLVMAQADRTYIFKLPNPEDRKRVAQCIGYDPAELDEYIRDLGRFEYLCYDVEDDELTKYPPLPKDMIVGHAAA